MGGCNAQAITGFGFDCRDVDVDGYSACERDDLHSEPYQQVFAPVSEHNNVVVATVGGVTPTLDLPFTTTGAVGGAAINAGQSGTATYDSDATYAAGSPMFGYGTAGSPLWLAPSTLTIKAFELDFADATGAITFSSMIIPGSVSNVGNTFTINYTPLPAALPLFAGGLGLLGMFARRRKQKASAIAAA
jgi:hypothetical protein